jgi:hypothetical protein
MKNRWGKVFLINCTSQGGRPMGVSSPDDVICFTLPFPEYFGEKEKMRTYLINATQLPILGKMLPGAQNPCYLSKVGMPEETLLSKRYK